MSRGQESGTASFADAEVKRETDAAILVEQDDIGEVWIPKSVLSEDSEVWKRGQTGTLVVQQWWAEKNKWT